MKTPLEQVRLDCGVSRDGSKAKNICTAAEHCGFNAEAFRMAPRGIQENGRFPCIIHSVTSRRSSALSRRWSPPH